MAEPASPYILDPRDLMRDVPLILPQPEEVAQQLLNLPPEQKKHFETSYGITLQGKIIPEIAHEITSERAMVAKEQKDSGRDVMPLLKKYHQLIGTYLKQMDGSPRDKAPHYKIFGMHDFAFISRSYLNTNSYGTCGYDGVSDMILFSSNFHTGLKQGNLLAHETLIHELFESETDVRAFGGLVRKRDRNGLLQQLSLKRSFAKQQHDPPVELTEATATWNPTTHSYIGMMLKEGIIQTFTAEIFGLVYPENIADYFKIAEGSYPKETAVVTYTRTKLSPPIPIELYAKAFTDRKSFPTLRAAFRKSVGPYAYEFLTTIMEHDQDIDESAQMYRPFAFLLKKPFTVEREEILHLGSAAIEAIQQSYPFITIK